MDSPPSELDDSNEQQRLIPVIELELLFHCPNSSCTRSFKKEHFLTKHMEKCGSIKKQQFVCTKVNSGKVYKNMPDLKRHVKDCGQIFACDNPGCSRSFNSEGDFSQHLRVCGGDPCPCGYGAHLMNHFVRHQTTCKVSFLVLLFPSNPKRLIVSSSTLFLALHHCA